VVAQQQRVSGFKLSLGRFSVCSCLRKSRSITCWNWGQPFLCGFASKPRHPWTISLWQPRKGGIAVQAKTTVNLSSGADGGLSKTVQQLIRHWLVCRDGRGEQLWDRSLDPSKDRLVLAVGPTAPASIRVDLPAALRSYLQPSPSALTQDQQRALEVFETCMREAWSNTTTEPWSPTVLQSVAPLVRVMTFDPAGAYANVMEGLAVRATTSDQARPLITALAQISQRWMTERSGGDLPQLRRAVMHAQVSLSAPPRFEDDIRKLRENSAQIAADLQPYEQIERNQGVIQITRECQAAALAAARAELRAIAPC
jgi:hypothetical protein